MLATCQASNAPLSRNRRAHPLCRYQFMLGVASWHVRLECAQALAVVALWPCLPFHRSPRSSTVRQRHCLIPPRCVPCCVVLCCAGQVLDEQPSTASASLFGWGAPGATPRHLPATDFCNHHGLHLHFDNSRHKNPLSASSTLTTNMTHADRILQTKRTGPCHLFSQSTSQSTSRGGPPCTSQPQMVGPSQSDYRLSLYLACKQHPKTSRAP